MCLITLGSGILKYGKKRKHFLSKLLKNITSSKSKAVGSHLFYLLIHLQLFLRRNQWSFSRLLRRKKTVTHSLPNVTLHWQGTLLQTGCFSNNTHTILAIKINSHLLALQNSISKPISFGSKFKAFLLSKARKLSPLPCQSGISPVQIHIQKQY